MVGGALLTTSLAFGAGEYDPHAPAAPADLGTTAALPARPLPHVARASAVVAPPPTHTVEVGDTFYGIADRYGLTTSALLRANPGVNPRRLDPGALLVVPDVETARPMTPAAAYEAYPDLAAMLEQGAHRHGLDPALVQAVAWRESRWNQRVTSHKGAVGVMQVLPSTAELVSRLTGRHLDPYELADNIDAGCAYLAFLTDREAGDLPAVLAGYHQGPESVASEGFYGITDDYIAEVMASRRTFAALGHHGNLD